MARLLDQAARRANTGAAPRAPGPVSLGASTRWPPSGQVTSSPTTLKQYIEFKTYDAAFDRDIKLEEDSDVVRARKDDAVVFYAWRSVKGGVIYGGCGPCHSYAQNDEGKRFTQAPPPLPAPRRGHAALLTLRYMSVRRRRR